MTEDSTKTRQRLQSTSRKTPQKTECLFQSLRGHCAVTTRSLRGHYASNKKLGQISSGRSAKIREPASAIKLKPSTKLDGKIRRVYAKTHCRAVPHRRELLRGLDTTAVTTQPRQGHDAARCGHDAFCGHDTVTV